MMHKILTPIVLKTKREVGPRGPSPMQYGKFRTLYDHDKGCETKRSCRKSNPESFYITYLLRDTAREV